MTLTPARFSCMTTLTRSTRSCTVLNSGMASFMITTIRHTRTGMAASTTRARRTFRRSTQYMPPIKRKGDRISMRMQVVKAFWIWVTSLVMRVTREPVLKVSMLAKVKYCTLWNRSLRMSLAKPKPALVEKYIFPTPPMMPVRAARIMRPAIFITYGASPFTMPTSIMRLMRVGCTRSMATSSTMNRGARRVHLR